MTPFEHVLRTAILSTLSRQRASLSVVASRLEISARTIQRRLAELGLEYSNLRDEARREQAIRLVTRGHMRMSDIAAVLGYRDPGSFTRAFRRWTGESPKQYRLGSRQSSPRERAQARRAEPGATGRPSTGKVAHAGILRLN